MASLSLQHITKRYPNGFEAVKDFNLEIADKEFIIFVGPSGCGKSTTLRMIAGLEEISDGTLKIDDKVVNDVEPKDRDIAMVFQNYALYPHMTVYDNMAFGLKLRKVPKDQIDKQVKEAAKILDLIALFRQMGFDGFLQVVCAVVAGKSDFHVGFSFVVMVFCYIISGAQRFCKRQPRKICQKMPMRRDQSFAYASSLTGSHHSFLHSVPGTSTAMWLNQLSRFAPCQCLTLAGIVMTVPGWRLTAGCPSS